MIDVVPRPAQVRPGCFFWGAAYASCSFTLRTAISYFFFIDNGKLFMCNKSIHRIKS